MIRYQLSKKRSGNHKTKGISEISGTTKNPLNKKVQEVLDKVAEALASDERWSSYFWSSGKVIPMFSKKLDH